MDIKRLEKLLGEIDELTLTPEQNKAYWDAKVEVLRAERAAQRATQKEESK